MSGERITLLRERVATLPESEPDKWVRAKRNHHRWGRHTAFVLGCPDCELRAAAAGSAGNTEGES